MESCRTGKNFDVKILADDANAFCIKGARYVALENKSEYKIQLINNKDVNCDAKVQIDGINVGTWRVKANSVISIQRPSNADRRFTFVAEDSKIAKTTGHKQRAEENGLIAVTFIPELKRYEKLVDVDDVRESRSPLTRRSSSGSRSRSISPVRGVRSDMFAKEYAQYVGGVTVGGRKSNQRFKDAEPINNPDKEHSEIIYIRLVVKEITTNRSAYPKRLDQ